MPFNLNSLGSFSVEVLESPRAKLKDVMIRKIVKQMISLFILSYLGSVRDPRLTLTENSAPFRTNFTLANAPGIIEDIKIMNSSRESICLSFTLTKMSFICTPACCAAELGITSMHHHQTSFCIFTFYAEKPPTCIFS